MLGTGPVSLSRERRYARLDEITIRRLHSLGIACSPAGVCPFGSNGALAHGHAANQWRFAGDAADWRRLPGGRVLSRLPEQPQLAAAHRAIGHFTLSDRVG